MCILIAWHCCNTILPMRINVCELLQRCCRGLCLCFSPYLCLCCVYVCMYMYVFNFLMENAQCHRLYDLVDVLTSSSSFVAHRNLSELALKDSCHAFIVNKKSGRQQFYDVREFSCVSECTKCVNCNWCNPSMILLHEYFQLEFHFNEIFLLAECNSLEFLNWKIKNLSNRWKLSSVATI